MIIKSDGYRKVVLGKNGIPEIVTMKNEPRWVQIFVDDIKERWLKYIGATALVMVASCLIAFITMRLAYGPIKELWEMKTLAYASLLLSVSLGTLLIFNRVIRRQRSLKRNL